MTKKDRVWPKSESRNNGSIGDRRDNSSPEVLSRNSVSPSRKSAAGKARPEKRGRIDSPWLGKAPSMAAPSHVTWWRPDGEPRPPTWTQGSAQDGGCELPRARHCELWLEKRRYDL
jgi:hypothetical protein